MECSLIKTSRRMPFYARMGYSTGVVENARKFNDDGYSIGLPPITFPDGTTVPAALSSYRQHLLEGRASLCNHSCRKYNTECVLEDVHVKKNIEAGREV